MRLPPVTKAAQVTWYKQAKGVQPEKMHMPNASNLEENCVPTTSHKVCSSDMAQASSQISSSVLRHNTDPDFPLRGERVFSPIKHSPVELSSL